MTMPGDRLEGRIMSHLRALSALESDRARGDYLYDRLSEQLSAGISLEREPIRAARRSSASDNIVLRIPGWVTDEPMPTLEVLAHYDTIGLGYHFSRHIPVRLFGRQLGDLPDPLSLKRGSLEPGSANDNLSGVAVSLTLAERLMENASRGEYPEHPVEIVFPCGEENGHVLNILRYLVPMAVLGAPLATAAQFVAREMGLPPGALASATTLGLANALARLPLTRPGLTGSTEHHRREEHNPNRVRVAVDIVGSEGDFIVPSTSLGITGLSMLGLLPVRYRPEVVDTLRELFLVLDDRPEAVSRLPTEYLPLGASDMATPTIGLRKALLECRDWGLSMNAAGIFAGGARAIRRMHTYDDRPEHVRAENLRVTERVLEEAVSALHSPWKSEEQLEGFSPERAMLFSAGDKDYLSLSGRLRGASVAAVYEAEKLDNSYATGDFVTWGISSPERLLRHAGKVKRRELEGTLDYHGEHYQVGPGTPWRKAGQLLYEATHEVVSRPMLPMAALVGAEAGLLIGAHWKILEYIANVDALPPEAKLGAAVAIGASALGLTFLSAYKTMIEVIAAAEPLGRMKMRFEQWSRHAAGAGALSVASDETL